MRNLTIIKKCIVTIFIRISGELKTNYFRSCVMNMIKKKMHLHVPLNLAKISHFFIKSIIIYSIVYFIIAFFFNL